MASTINASNSGAGGLISAGDASGVLALQTAGTTAVTIDTSQRVGIGVASPSVPFQVQAISTNGYTARFNGRSSDNYSELTFYNNANSTNYATVGADQAAMYIGTNASLPVTFTAGGVEIARIFAAGNFVVGSTSLPSGSNAFGSIQNSCSASGNSLYTKNTNASPYGLEIQYSGAAPNNTGSAFIEAFDTSATRFAFRSNGGLANYSANNVNLSDQREKKDIALSPNYLDKICQIPVKTFLFNDQTDTDLNLGVIAQDVQTVAPELVMETNWAGKGEPEKMRLSIYQTDLQYALMKSIQELKAINDTQAETINALTARIVALEGK